MPPCIRPYAAGDAAALIDVFVRSVRGLGARDYTAAQVEAWASRIGGPERTHARCSDGRLVLVAVDPAGRALAFIDLEDDGHIDMLFCVPEAAGTGVASALHERLEETARRRGMARLYTEASEAARRFFLRRGFAVLRRRDFDIDGVAIHNYAMEKPLAPPDPHGKAGR